VRKRKRKRCGGDCSFRLQKSSRARKKKRERGQNAHPRCAFPSEEQKKEGLATLSLESRRVLANEILRRADLTRKKRSRMEGRERPTLANPRRRSCVSRGKQDCRKPGEISSPFVEENQNPVLGIPFCVALRTRIGCPGTEARQSEACVVSICLQCRNKKDCISPGKEKKPKAVCVEGFASPPPRGKKPTESQKFVSRLLVHTKNPTDIRRGSLVLRREETKGEMCAYPSC